MPEKAGLLNSWTSSLDNAIDGTSNANNNNFLVIRFAPGVPY